MMKSTTQPAAPAEMIAICPSTGRHLRAATSTEIAAWLAQPTRSAAHGAFALTFHKPLRVGSVLVTDYTGPGVSHCGAGF